MTLLTIVQQAGARLGIPPVSSVLTNSDDRVRQMGALATTEGRELCAIEGISWQQLVKEQTFAATATEEQAGVIPADYLYMVNETAFNRTRVRRLLGPLTPEEWQAEKALSTSVLRDAYRIRGDAFLVTPIPAAGDVFAFEYVSSNWVVATGETAATKDAFTADSDGTVFDDELLRLGVEWRFLQALGLDYAEQFRTYERRLANLAARNGSRRTLDLSQHRPTGARRPYVPEGTWTV